ncbi:MAG TPA: ferrous iron transport protein A [Planctomycetota bacterium]|nr:ferrous iron transport protein A [Planctomycetota bacterium]
MSLAQLSKDEGGRVLSIRAANVALAQRLLAMGFLPGAQLRIVQVAPFGDPITVELNGWRVSLRRADAASVDVARV